MSDSRCEDCRFWTYPRTDYRNVIHLNYDTLETFEQEEAVAMSYEQQYGECQSVVFDPRQRDYPIPEASPVAVVSDGSGYTAHLFTKGDFGCTSFEAKP